MRHTTGYSLLDHNSSEDILEELNTDPVTEKLGQYN